MATIDPLLLASRYGSAACASRTVCMRSTSKEVYQFSSVSGIASALMFATTASSPPSRSGRRLHPGPQRRAVPDVELDAAHPRAPAGQRLLGRLDLAGVAGAELDDGALVDERLDDRAADAAGAAGDEHAGAGQLQVHGVLLGWLRGAAARGAQVVVQAAVGGAPRAAATCGP